MDFKDDSLIIAQGIKIQKLISLSNFTTWRVGGRAEWFAEPSNQEELKKIISWANLQKMPIQTIGAGSNLLINDIKIEGLTICTKKLHGFKLDKTDGLIEISAGESIPNLSRRAARAGLHGLEWAIGIPGTVGGAAVMNAGAQGGCTAEWLESIKVLPLNGKTEFEIQSSDMNFSYRQSRLQHEELLLISAKFNLEPGHDHNKLNDLTNANLNHRINSQPYQLPSCGSVFRNPEPLKAGKLIEDLGLKGFRIGGAEISKIHGNFIVNTGNATPKDIKILIEVIQKKVQQAYGVLLQPEIKKLGFQSTD